MCAVSRVASTSCCVAANAVSPAGSAAIAAPTYSTVAVATRRSGWSGPREPASSPWVCWAWASSGEILVRTVAALLLWVGAADASMRAVTRARIALTSGCCAVRSIRRRSSDAAASIARASTSGSARSACPAASSTRIDSLAQPFGSVGPEMSQPAWSAALASWPTVTRTAAWRTYVPRHCATTEQACDAVSPATWTSPQSGTASVPLCATVVRDRSFGRSMSTATSSPATSACGTGCVRPGTDNAVLRGSGWQPMPTRTTIDHSDCARTSAGCHGFAWRRSRELSGRARALVTGPRV